MNTKFKIGNIVIPTGGTLRIYKITGLSDDGYYMKNFISDIPLGTVPGDKYLVSATIEDLLKAHCYEHAMFPNKFIDDCIEAFKMQAAHIHFSDSIDNYKSNISIIIAIDFVTFAFDWLLLDELLEESAIKETKK